MEGGFCFDFGDPPVAPTPTEVADVPAPPAPQVWCYTDEEAEALVRDLDQEELSVQKEQNLKLVRLQPSLFPAETCAFATGLKERDILPGVYEGGFKLWSCAVDLVKHLRDEGIDLSGRKVLEAGCGHGLPSIHALTSGASRVVFQDYNVEVLKLLTAPNVLINSDPEGSTLRTSCEFWSGDWVQLAASPQCAAHTASFDVILTTDTLYTVAAVDSLLVFLRAFLAPTGTVYIGSKTLYFGCGGGVSELHDALAKQLPHEGRVLTAVQVKKIDDGMDNVREIVALTWKEA
eukprot:TRINITY_DN1660_c0_g1_i1.p1 TRINITY_DN1660_c0_g1~~TRINITY_DN1660_c0_g1_i1.p1  ORF type:complete len:290 (+),score=64.54 TRINITY_DN1660_c0_g1_i1:37-906(+)